MAGTLERIKQFIDNQEISIRAFEIAIGFSNGAFASQLKNNKSIGHDKIENILNVYPNLDANWLLKGSGKMFLEVEEKQHFLNDPGAIYSEPNAELLETQRELIVTQRKYIQQLEAKNTVEQTGNGRAS